MCAGRFSRMESEREEQLARDEARELRARHAPAEDAGRRESRVQVVEAVLRRWGMIGGPEGMSLRECAEEILAAAEVGF